MEAIEPLEEAGLVVKDVLVLIDRKQGGRADLAQRGYALHAVLDLMTILDVLKTAGYIDAQTYAEVAAYLQETSQ